MDEFKVHHEKKVVRPKQRAIFIFDAFFTVLIVTFYIQCKMLHFTLYKLPVAPSKSNIFQKDLTGIIYQPIEMILNHARG